MSRPERLVGRRPEVDAHGPRVVSASGEARAITQAQAPCWRRYPWRGTPDPTASKVNFATGRCGSVSCSFLVRAWTWGPAPHISHTPTRITRHNPHATRSELCEAPVWEHGLLKRVLPSRTTLCPPAHPVTSQPPTRSGVAEIPGVWGVREAGLGDNGVRVGILDDDQQKVRVRRHHDLMLLRPDSEEGEVVLRVEVPHD